MAQERQLTVCRAPGASLHLHRVAETYNTLKTVGLSDDLGRVIVRWIETGDLGDLDKRWLDLNVGFVRPRTFTEAQPIIWEITGDPKARRERGQLGVMECATWFCVCIENGEKDRDLLRICRQCERLFVRDEALDDSICQVCSRRERKRATSQER